MKQFYILFLTVMLCICPSCSSHEEIDCSEQQLHIGKLYLSSSAPAFGDATRAQSGQWEDGDEVFLSFGKNVGSGKAVYIASQGEWNLSWKGQFPESLDETCTVYYFRGDYTTQGSVVIPASIQCDCFVAPFADEAATFFRIEEDIFVHANLKPMTWSLSFNGEAETDIRWNADPEISYFSNVNLEEGEIYQTLFGEQNLHVAVDGFTQKQFGFFGTNDIYTFMVHLNGKIYFRLFSPEMLKVGQSGYFKLPTDSNLFGWEEEITSMEINIEGFSTDIDLDNDVGGATNQNSSQDILTEGYSEDIDLD